MEQSPALTALSALAHETRLEIVRLLMRAGPDGMVAGRIASGVECSASGLSFHLKELGQAGLVTGTRNGRQVTYVVDRARVGGLIHYLLNDCCGADPEVWACCRASRDTG